MKLHGFGEQAHILYDLHDHKLWNRARWQEPAFHKASYLIDDPPLILAGVEIFEHWAQWNINSLMVKYVQIWNSILSQKKTLVARLVHELRHSEYR